MARGPIFMAKIKRETAIVAVLFIAATAGCDTGQKTGQVVRKEQITITTQPGITVPVWRLHLSNGMIAEVPSSVYDQCAEGDQFDGSMCN